MSYRDWASPNRSSRSSQYGLWILMVLAAGTPRILAAFFLPNEEGDPYAYLHAIQLMRSSLLSGNFTLSELFGFWLPLYQFVCAVLSSVMGHPLYVAKLVSAVCGTGICLLVFDISLRLTSDRMLSLLSYALIAFNPIHIMYSAFSMSDVPHAFLVMGSLWFAGRSRWFGAAVLVAAGGLMRPESWVLIPLLPALQWLLERRISIVASLVGLSSPLVWLYISWSATGNVLEYFRVRNDYITELISAAPGLAQFRPSIVLTDMRTLLYSGGPAVIVACLLSAILLINNRGLAKQFGSGVLSVLRVTLSYFFAFLGFLVFAYFTKNQPAIFARYCLVLFALGLPVLAWILLTVKGWKRSRALALSTVLASLCVVQFIFQLRDGASFVGHVSQKRIVANYLKDNTRVSMGLKVFCDDDTVKILAGIPAESFVSSASSPIDSNSFLDYLRENRVEYLVYERRDRSAAENLFRELGEERIRDLFQLAASTKIDICVYRTVF